MSPQPHDDLRETLLDTATKLLHEMTVPKLKSVIARVLVDEGIIDTAPDQDSSKTTKARQRTRSRDYGTSLDTLSRALSACGGRATPEQIVASIQDNLQEPTPKDPEEAAVWVKKGISRASSHLRKWPDGSWSKLKWKPTLAA